MLDIKCPACSGAIHYYAEYYDGFHPGSRCIPCGVHFVFGTEEVYGSEKEALEVAHKLTYQWIVQAFTVRDENELRDKLASICGHMHKYMYDNQLDEEARATIIGVFNLGIDFRQTIEELGKYEQRR